MGNIYSKNHYPILRFEEDWTSISEPSIVITFDDGYYPEKLRARGYNVNNQIRSTSYIYDPDLNKLETTDLFGLAAWHRVVIDFL